MDPDDTYIQSVSDGGSQVVGTASKVILNLVNSVQMPQNTVISLRLPIYNPQSARANQISYIVDANVLTCQGFLNVNKNVICSIQSIDKSTDQRLIITNVFSKDVQPGTQFQVMIDSMLNPLSMTPRVFVVELAILNQQDGAIYPIDKGIVTWKAMKPAQLNNILIQADTTIVQEYAQYTINFTPPVEIEKGAYTVIQFPYPAEDSNEEQYFQFDSNLNQVQTVGGMYGVDIQAIRFQADSVNLNIVTKDATQTDSPSSPCTIIIFKIANPHYVGTFGSFEISILDQNLNLIAQATSGINYKTTSGQILKVQMFPEDPQIEAVSRLWIYFRPIHFLKKNAQIQIELPNDIQITCLTLPQYDSIQFTVPLSLNCNQKDENSQVLTIQNAFQADYYLQDRTTLRFTLENTKMSISQRDEIFLKISTLTFEGRLVDYYEFNPTDDQPYLFQVLPKPFANQQVSTIDQTETFVEATFQFQLTTQNTLPIGCVIDIILPLEVDIPETTDDSQITVVPKKNMDTENTAIKPPVVQANGTKQIRITSLINEKDLPPKSVIQWQINYFLTPQTTRTSQTFKIYVKDKDERIINFVEDGLFITMTNGKSIDKLIVDSSSKVVGNLAAHSFAFKSSQQLVNTDYLTIIYPDDTQPPIKKVRCQGNGLLKQDVQCNVVQNIVRTVGLPLNDSKDQSQFLNLTIFESVNPLSSKPSRGYKIYVKDKDGYTKAQMIDESQPSAKLEMLYPANIDKFSFVAVDQRQKAITAYKLGFNSKTPYPKDSYIKINLNPDEIGPKDASSVGQVTCSSNLQFKIVCTFLQLNELKIEGVIKEDLIKNSYIELMITNLENFVTSPLTTASWKLTVYSGEDYFIDQITDGLSVEFKCYAPCEECAWNVSPPDPRYCRKCNSLIDKLILYNGKCFSTCPTGTWYNASEYTCSKCDPKCVECDMFNGNICTSCNPNSQWPFLDGQTCKSECPFGKYGDRQSNQCLPCQAPCQSCKQSPNDCNSCDIKSAQKFFMIGQCQNQCDFGYIVPLGETDFVCQKCYSNCESCIGTLDKCVTCTGDTPFLSKLDNTCKNKCPDGLTVLEDPSTKHCEICDDICGTCSGDVDYCTGCKNNYNLYSFLDSQVDSLTQVQKQTCVKDCEKIDLGDGLDNRMLSINNKCTLCQAPCLQCQDSLNKCLTCLPGKYMFNYQCLDECPDKYSPTIDNKCVLTGFFCKFGYEINAAGDGCYLKARVCNGRDVLNYDKTKCIPVSEFFIPIPMLILSFIGIYFVFKDKKQNKNSRFIPNSICVLSIFETLGLICFVGLSNDYGIYPAFALSSCALFFLYGLNIFSYLIYLLQLKQDSAFKYWEQEFEFSTMTIVSTALFANFKLQRAFYSRFQDKKQFTAVFQNEETFFRSLMLTGLAQMLTVSLPTLVAVIFCLIYISPSFQISMFAIDLLVLEILIIILLIFELYRLRVLLQNIENQRKVGNNGQINKRNPQAFMLLKNQPTKNKFQNGLSIIQSMTYSDQSTLLINLIKKIEHIAKTKRALQFKTTTVQEIQEMQQDESRKNQLRRCISFNEIREYKDDLEDKEFDQLIASIAINQIDQANESQLINQLSPEDKEFNRLFNFISEPSSPRQKEMLLNVNFSKRMNQLSRAYTMRDQYDNCYHEPKPLHHYPFKNCNVISKAVQTNVLELLGVDDLLPSFNKSLRKSQKEVFEEGEQSIDEVEGLQLVTKEWGDGIVQNIIDNFEGFQDNKNRKILSDARMKSLPPFKIQDIVGRFDRDVEGQLIIISEGIDEYGFQILLDLDGKKVNERGYFVNRGGEVLTRDGIIVFRADEVDSDGEIPMPFCYYKNRMLSSFNLNHDKEGLLNHLKKKNSPVDQDQTDKELDQVEKEFQKLRAKALKKGKNGDSIIDDQFILDRSMNSEDLENEGLTKPPSKLVNMANVNRPTLYNQNDEDFMDRVQKPLKPLTKAEMIRQLKIKGILPEIRKRIKKIPKQNNQDDLQALLNPTIEEDPYEEPDDIIQDDQFGENIDQLSSEKKSDRENSGERVEEIQIVMPQEKPKPQKKRKIQVPAKLSAADKLHQELLEAQEREKEMKERFLKFQAMLARYPIKPKNKKGTNALANKNLERVYGKIKAQYNKDAQKMDRNQILSLSHSSRDQKILKASYDLKLSRDAALSKENYDEQNEMETYRPQMQTDEDLVGFQFILNNSDEKSQREKSQLFPREMSAKLRDIYNIYKQGSPEKSYFQSRHSSKQTVRSPMVLKDEPLRNMGLNFIEESQSQKQYFGKSDKKANIAAYMNLVNTESEQKFNDYQEEPSTTNLI